MIIFSIYDKLGNESQKDFIQESDNIAILKRDLMSRYKKLVAEKNTVELDKLKDHNIIFYGEIKNGVITLYSKDEMRDISLTVFLGLVNKSEVKANECQSN